jgi:hypothetical protein
MVRQWPDLDIREWPSSIHSSRSLFSIAAVQRLISAAAEGIPLKPAQAKYSSLKKMSNFPLRPVTDCIAAVAIAGWPC